MTNQPLDELYFKWLYQQVESPIHEPKPVYWSLARQMYTKEFVWFIPNDDNRVEDGRDLRYEFLDTQTIADVDSDWMALGCSFLELLVGLSRRLSFQTDAMPRFWFYQMLDNIDLNVCTDTHGAPEELVDAVLDTVIWRTYKADGKGGLFPLKNPPEDQRTAELWSQMSAYILEEEYE